MPSCKPTLSFFALFAIAATTSVVGPLTSSSADAATSYPNLCDSTRGVCVIVPFDEAPRLDQTVCWDGRTARLMGSTGCTSGRPYSLAFGYVDNPILNTVTPLAPVIDTCVAGYCVSGEITLGEVYEDGVACCDAETGDCSPPDQNGLCTIGDITWCKTIDDNGDGTLTCHE